MDALEDDDPRKRNAALTSALHHGGSRLKKLAEGAWVYVVALNCAEFVQARFTGQDSMKECTKYRVCARGTDHDQATSPTHLPRRILELLCRCTYST